MALFTYLLIFYLWKFWMDWVATNVTYRDLEAQIRLLEQIVLMPKTLAYQRILMATGEAFPVESKISYHNILKLEIKAGGIKTNYSNT